MRVQLLRVCAGTTGGAVPRRCRPAAEDAGFVVVGRSANATDLMLKVRSYEPDVAIVDIKMPLTQTDEGLQAAREIREKYPHTAVLVLSPYAEPGYARCCRSTPKALVTCSRTGSTMCPSSPRRYAASRPAVRHSTPQ